MEAKALAQMMEQVAGNANGRKCNRFGWDKERRHEKHETFAEGTTLFEERLHLVEEAVAVCLHRHAAFLGELREQFSLLGGQFGGNLHFDREQLIAGGLTLEARNPEAFEA